MKSIEVLLTLASPLHVAYPGNKDKKDGREINRTVKQRLMSVNEVSSRFSYIPFYPANGFRGGLRRKAMSIVAEHLKSVDGPLPQNLYIGLSCGATSGQPDSGLLSIEEAVRGRKNVYMGLFGGGARMLPSAYRVSDMVPVLKETVDSGQVPERYLDSDWIKPLLPKAGAADEKPRSVAGDWLTDSRTSVRVDDLVRAINPNQIMELVADPIASVSEWQKAALESDLERKNSKKAVKSGEGTDVKKKTTVANMMGVETVMAGVPFFFRIDVASHATDAQIGLLLMSLSALFRENSFGGWVRCGFGKVKVRNIVIHNEDGILHSWDESVLTNSMGAFTLPATAMEWVEAATSEIGDLSTADMIGFFQDMAMNKTEGLAARRGGKGKAKTAGDIESSNEESKV